MTTSYDLLKDSLPVVRWTIRHAGIAASVGALTIAASDVPPSDVDRIAAVLRGA